MHAAGALGAGAELRVGGRRVSATSGGVRLFASADEPRARVPLP